MQVKVCGLVKRSNILEIDNLGVSYIGLNFYPKSERYFLKDDKTPIHVQTRAALVGIFVNASVDTIVKRAMLYNLDIIQLHGNEAPEMVDMVKLITRKKVWKAIPISSVSDLALTEQYQSMADGFVFDTKSDGYGGSGSSFDWSILSAYKGQTPFFLAGGLSLDLLAELNTFKHPLLRGYDINSKFEVQSGVKSVELVNQFLQKVTSHDTN